ncbi:MAG: pimeloyl-ACP methyl ester carboxylesterase [Oceanicoccus sp.]|jgi:pimeloyl-ACP methyl ester carboxylesterase
MQAMSPVFDSNLDRTSLKYESITVSLPSTDQLQLTRFFLDKNNLGPPVFMLHSTAQDSRTFCTEDGGGLGCYLARQGYDVYVADLRGKGKSWPQINGSSDYGIHQTITEDIPALVNKIISKRGQVAQIWIGHGWGSVLMTSYYARFGEHQAAIAPVSRMAHFAARRQLLGQNARKTLVFNAVWRRLARLLVGLKGYLPVHSLKLGLSNESRGNYSDYLRWSTDSAWCDPQDGFDYGQAISEQQLPPSYYFAASSDKVYGDVVDVRAFIQKLGNHDVRLMVLSKCGGNRRDYSHINMLQHPDAEQDHFPLLLAWLKQV